MMNIKASTMLDPAWSLTGRTGTVNLVALGDFLEVSSDWPTPTVVVCDGPYGLGLYPGEPNSHRNLAEWYKPHVDRWTEASNSRTTLWFWGTEIGWATVHPVLEEAGWIYHSANIWDKGKSHIAGNVNSWTIRRFPVVSEMCVQYVRPTLLVRNGQEISVQEWFRSEWQRTGLPFRVANEACGVADAATRKYLTGDHNWYMPPPERFQMLADYANSNGAPDGRPYFDLSGTDDMPLPKYDNIRATFNCPVGVTNVWHQPTVPAPRRTRVDDCSGRHPNEKPLSLMELIIKASSEEGDVVWDPFGGVGTVALACANTGRSCYTSEIHEPYWRATQTRLKGEEDTLPLF